MTEKKFYKLDEYEGKLPNPKMFPTQGSTVVAVKDCPNTFTDGFMMDLNVDKEERQRLKEKVMRTVSRYNLRNLREEVKKAKILLSEPQYIHDRLSLVYVMTAKGVHPIAIQVKYYRYFRNRYPECKFYTSEQPMGVKVIRVGRKLVGLVMPVMLPMETEG